MARVAAGRVVIEDTLYTSEEVERAEKLRDPTHVRSYSEAGVARALEAPASRSSGSSASRRRIDLDDWLARCELHRRGRRARARAARDRSSDDGSTWQRRQVDPPGRKASRPDGDHRRQRHAARRPGPDRLRGPLPRAAQPRLRHERRRRRHAGQGRAGRRGHPCLRHGRRRGRRGGREHLADLRARALRARRDLRGGRRRHRHRRLHHRAHPGARDAARLHLQPPEGRDADRPELPGRPLAGQGERRDHPGRGVRGRARSGSSRARGR